ncbi:uncharacterized protein [Rutidosis leptorrhynchoides]|uniref:uncharacterized protein isoform X2 n=1 Tax=Rutidosis leptorrhynchoides TaxID=125765 RepID=UPI003A9A429F
MSFSSKDKAPITSSCKLIDLKNSDLELFEDEKNAPPNLVPTIKHMSEHDCADTSIPIPRNETFRDELITAIDDDDSKKLTHNKIQRKENMQDKQIVANPERAKQKNDWDPELLRVPFDKYETLTPKQQRQWLCAHFIVRRRASAHLYQFKSDEDEDAYQLYD